MINASPSSRGLGHHPFTVATGVRIPVGTPIIILPSQGRPVARLESYIGAIAQLGERLHGMQEVSGSIPLGSTIYQTLGLSGQMQVLKTSPSSRGLGHYPFTVATGVRIPVGTPLQPLARQGPAG